MPADQGSENAARYHIRVKGVLDPKWSDWFDGFSISWPEEDQTLFTGPVVDQAALHGLLAKINDLGLPLLSIELEGEKNE